MKSIEDCNVITVDFSNPESVASAYSALREVEKSGVDIPYSDTPEGIKARAEQKDFRARIAAANLDRLRAAYPSMQEDETAARVESYTDSTDNYVNSTDARFDRFVSDGVHSYGLKRQTISFLVAATGTGKSDFTASLVFNWLRAGQRVLWYSGEDTKSNMYKRLALMELSKEAEGEANWSTDGSLTSITETGFNNWLTAMGRYSLTCIGGGVKLPNKEDFIQFCLASQFDVIVIDNMMTAMEDFEILKGTADYYARQKELVQQLNEIKHALPRAVLFICAHPPKGLSATEEPDTSSIYGDSAIINYAEYAFGLYLKTDDTKNEKGKIIERKPTEQRVLKILKERPFQSRTGLTNELLYNKASSLYSLSPIKPLRR